MDEGEYSMRLVDPTDDELNAAFAKYVAGWGASGVDERPIGFVRLAGWETFSGKPTTLRSLRRRRAAMARGEWMAFWALGVADRLSGSSI